MNRYRKPYRLGALVLLVCFLATLSGVSATAGHDCCGNCAAAKTPQPVSTQSNMVSSDCCSTRPACTCTFESTGDRDLPAYSIVRVNATVDDQFTAMAATLVGSVSRRDNRLAAFSPRRLGNQPRSGPLYITNQSFLC